MDGRRRLKSFTRRLATLALAIVALPSAVYGYVPGARWSTTASGSAGTTGDSITLTWSLVADGTAIPRETTSTLIDFLDEEFGAGPGGANYTQRPWFALLDDSFQRWSELGGINFVYEPNDNGAQLGSSAGVRGVRGDIRIGGTVIAGSASTLAYANYPNNGDIVIDTAETSFFFQREQ